MAPIVQILHNAGLSVFIQMAFFWPIGSEYLYCYTHRRMKLKRSGPPKVSLRSRRLPVFSVKGWYPSIRRHSGIWGAAGEAVRKKKKFKNSNPKNIFKKITKNSSLAINTMTTLYRLLTTTISTEGSLPRPQTSTYCPGYSLFRKNFQTKQIFFRDTMPSLHLVFFINCLNL